jgi:hypothetical protein
MAREQANWVRWTALIVAMMLAITAGAWVILVVVF